MVLIGPGVGDSLLLTLDMEFREFITTSTTKMVAQLDEIERNFVTTHTIPIFVHNIVIQSQQNLVDNHLDHPVPLLQEYRTR